MYRPGAFRVDQEAVLFDAIERWNFGLLLDVDGDGRPEGTHLPFIADRGQRMLLTHLAAANPQAGRLDGRPVTAVFRGPHAHVSPHDLGDPQRNVPTWDYVAVHAYGRARLLEGARAREVLDRIVARHERGAWSAAELDAALREPLHRALRVFAVDIDSLDGCWKLSQNKDAATRRRLARALRRRRDGDARELAAMMSAAMGTDAMPALRRLGRAWSGFARRVRGRRQLCRLDARARSDLGIRREHARAEAAKPGWRR